MDSTEDTEPERPDAVEDASHPRAQSPQPRPPLSDDPAMPGRFRDAVRPLDDIDARPVSEHAETYDAVHRDLRAVLDDVEKNS